jgi:hypothetical protein
MAGVPEESTNRTSEKFKKRLLDLIFEQDCTKVEFAERAGVNKEVISRASVYAIVPSVKSLIKIADFIGCSLEYVLGESNDRTFYKSESGATFHDRIKALCEEAKIGYGELSAKMPFAKNSIYEWLRTGGLPSLDYLKALAEYFKVGLDYLLGRSDEK